MTTTSSFRSTCFSSAVALASLRVSVVLMPASLIVSIARCCAQTATPPGNPVGREADRGVATGLPGHDEQPGEVHTSRLLGGRQVCKALSHFVACTGTGQEHFMDALRRHVVRH